MSSNSVNSYTPSEFSLSEKAVNHFSDNLAGKDFEGIRLSVSESSGCSGYTYQIDYVEDKDSKDLVFTFDSVSVFIDEESFKFLKGTKVDFLAEGVNEGIKFINPNVKAICGCGESFEVDI
mgnify:FL=1